MSIAPTHRIRCSHCRGTHSSVDEVRQCSIRPQISTVDDVAALLEQRAPRFDDLLRAAAVCRKADDSNLLDRTIQVTLANVTGEVPPSQWKPVVRDASSFLLAGARFDTLSDDAERAIRRMRSIAKRVPSEVEEAIEEEVSLLAEITVMLADDTSEALVSLSSRLRKMRRPDLALEAATRAVTHDPHSVPARTTMAGAHMDLDEIDEAVVSLQWVESREQTFYGANAWSRAERLRDNLDEAESWAKKANERDPEGIAGIPLLASIVAQRGDHDGAMELMREYNLRSGERRSLHWPVFLAAKDLVRSGKRDEGWAVLVRLAEDGYVPAKRMLLEEGDTPF